MAGSWPRRCAVRRVQWFELEDQSWFPALWRDAMTAYISRVMEATDMLAPIVPKVGEALARSGATRVIDLCSGGGYPSAYLATRLADAGHDVPVVASDLYPNGPALAEAVATSGGRLAVVDAPVDATAVPAEQEGLRTLFNAFHHFPPDVARRVLADAHDAGQPIAVFEVVDRRPANLLGLPFVPLAVALMLPFLRPFRWGWVPFTYLLPTIPLAGLWDGFVSALRIYQPDELRSLVVGLDGFDWDIGRIPLPGAPIFATYLVGTPKG